MEDTYDIKSLQHFTIIFSKNFSSKEKYFWPKFKQNKKIQV